MASNKCANEILEQLMEGNRRYRSNKARHPHLDTTRLCEVAGGQHPIAIILGCSDSRVPPEALFDCGLGDLFVIRVAGNVLDDIVLGTIEYAVVELKVTLIIVLGHERCGAVTAAVNGTVLPGHMQSLMVALEPAIHSWRSNYSDPVEAVVLANIRVTSQIMEASEPIIAQKVREGKLLVVGARYGLADGQVTIVGKYPECGMTNVNIF
jgi:carbonic anhydrase